MRILPALTRNADATFAAAAAIVSLSIIMTGLNNLFLDIEQENKLEIHTTQYLKLGGNKEN